MLLSRGDVHGRALAKPDSLTRAERYHILGWPSPEIVERRIRKATRQTGKELSTPKELFDKAEREGTSACSRMELGLMLDHFYLEKKAVRSKTKGAASGIKDGLEDEEGDDGYVRCRIPANSDPGNKEAYNLVFRLEGIEHASGVFGFHGRVEDPTRRGS